MDSFKNMINLLRCDLDKQLVIQLEQQINDYDYDEAINTLDRLRQGLLPQNVK